MNDKLKNFFLDINNLTITWLLINIFDITSTLHLVAKYGASMEKNPIISAILLKPYFSIVYTLGYALIILFIRKSKNNIKFLWVFVFFYLLIAPIMNLVVTFWMVM